jgi:1-acyl-sn-glycerol-3-phosphate acyltransferase
VANHGGAAPTGGPMIAKALKESGGQLRPLHLLTDPPLQALPGLGMLFTKLGAVPDHPDNVQRLLFDEHQLVLAVPERAQASTRACGERHRVRSFEGGAFIQAAVRAGAPIVPIAVLGAQEASPLFGRVDVLRRLTRIPRVPLSTGFPLPAKFRIRFLAPVSTSGLSRSAPDGAAAQALAQDVRSLIEANLLQMTAERRNVWLG